MSGRRSLDRRGWCPGALTPMESGDGLILRIRPYGGRLLPAQARLIADLARQHGTGRIALSNRANLQLRGIHDAALPQIHAALQDAGLLDTDPAAEARRNILTTPLWSSMDETAILAQALADALLQGPDLPAKFGFAVDTGAATILGTASADIRIERAAEGLILRADGMDLGMPVTADAAVASAMGLAHWFAEHAGPYRRMAGLVAAGIIPPLTTDTPPLTAAPPGPGLTTAGLCLALPFGEVEAGLLQDLAIAPMRLTPWRSLILEGVTDFPDTPGLIHDAADPLLRVACCPGAPACASASVETRALARQLAPLIPAGQHLHVSGCAKGCACARKSGLTLTGRAGRFDLIRHGRADDAPLLTGLALSDIPALILQSKGPHAPFL